MPYRRNILQALGAASVASCMVQALAMGARPLSPGIRSLKGTVRVNGSPAQEGQLVLNGDTIATGKASEVVYVMGNNAYLMREDSQVQFASEGITAVLRVVTGKVLAVFGPGKLRIDMPTATVGIRGTACYIETTDTSTYFCLCYGTAELSPKADPSQARTLVTRYHDSPFWVGNDTAAPLLRAAPVINHRDYELTLLEALVGRLPPFAGKESTSY
ncbi:FecR domain-containing protein [Rhodoferax sp.]|uniref:FecR domain-containing protein n=1 Tax=Rhodoferax sp. TaxID=50421 RepID=UPI002ACE8756|nr:FecR domain-containing protein [Rhodoferax sp.]MDZ7921948.1 FecR domain-containing protein [Rhodoferax sp.]